MKLKKLASAALAGALALSLSAPAFAAANTTTFDISLNSPTINVTVPDSGTVVLNPYKLGYTPQGGSETTDQIITSPLYIVNTGNVPMVVDATVTGTTPSKDVTFATASTQGGTKAVTTKSVFMYVEILPTADASTAPTFATAYDKTKTSQILVGAKATTVKGIVTLDAAGGTNPAAGYRLAGDMASTPTSAWAEADAVSVSVAFTFTPTVASGS